MNEGTEKHKEQVDVKKNYKTTERREEEWTKLKDISEEAPLAHSERKK